MAHFPEICRISLCCSLWWKRRQWMEEHNNKIICTAIPSLFSSRRNNIMNIPMLRLIANKMENSKNGVRVRRREDEKNLKKIAKQQWNVKKSVKAQALFPEITRLQFTGTISPRTYHTIPGTSVHFRRGPKIIRASFVSSLETIWFA